MNLQLRSTDPEPRSFCGFCASEDRVQHQRRTVVGWSSGLGHHHGIFQPASHQLHLLPLAMQPSNTESRLAVESHYTSNESRNRPGFFSWLLNQEALTRNGLPETAALQLSHGLDLASSAGIPVSQYSIWLLRLAFQSASTRSRPASATVCGLMIHTPLKFEQETGPS